MHTTWKPHQTTFTMRHATCNMHQTLGLSRSRAGGGWGAIPAEVGTGCRATATVCTAAINHDQSPVRDLRRSTPNRCSWHGRCACCMRALGDEAAWTMPPLRTCTFAHRECTAGKVPRVARHGVPAHLSTSWARHTHASEGNQRVFVIHARAEPDTVGLDGTRWGRTHRRSCK